MPTAMKDSPFRLWNATGVTERAASLSTAEQNEHQEAEMGVSNVDNRRKRERERERERVGEGGREANTLALNEDKSTEALRCSRSVVHKQTPDAPHLTLFGFLPTRAACRG